MSGIRVALAQLNPTVGDLNANKALIVEAIEKAKRHGCDLVVFPELALTGYPPEDLLNKEDFVAQAETVLEELAESSRDICVVVGAVVRAERVNRSLANVRDARDVGMAKPAALANVAAVLRNACIEQLIPKRLLPNYAVFDEQRWFVPGTMPGTLVVIGEMKVGVLVCEDLWSAEGPASDLARAGADILVSINASPFARGQQERRETVGAARTRETGAALVYVNQVGGQDELVFDGGSFVMDAEGTIMTRAKSFVIDTVSVTIENDGSILGDDLNAIPEDLERIYEALVLGTRDYLAKNGFTKALIGLSGGIDSAIVATIAADAIGAHNVRCIAMPSRYSSDHSLSDAEDLARRLGVSFETREIEPAHRAYESMLGAALGARPSGLTDENLQSRLRGVLLMGISNATGAIVLTTGNKSELATGYSTLYGDSAGGFGVIKDVPKTLVYALCAYRNQRSLDRGDPAPIPENILTKAPSAELRPDQRDEDSLPAYEILDPILAGYIEDDLSVEALIAQGYDPGTVARVCRLVDIAEYKRRQMPPGPRITSKAFGKDRRMPITNGFRA
jgi:NAD+ synthase (glutamine-hydrolysing)